MPTNPNFKKKSTRITFRLPDGRRKELFIPTSHAKLVEQKVKQLIFNLKYGFNIDADYKWFQSMPDASNLKRAIIRWGILEQVGQPNHTIQELLVIWLPTFKKGNTQRIYNNAFRRFAQWLPDGETTNLQDITTEDIVLYRQSLVESSLYKPATIAGEMRSIKAGLSYAQKLQWLVDSPAKGISINAADTVNTTNWQYITVEQAVMVINAPSTSARYAKVIALERFAGFRGASELNELYWRDITPPAGDQRGTMVITSPKTERVGKEQRTIPISPELQAVLDKTPPEDRDGRVITQQSSTQTAHYVRMAFSAAGIVLKDSYLRRSYCSDIMARYGADPVLYEALTGHSFKVGMRHYQILHPGRLGSAFKNDEI